MCGATHSCAGAVTRLVHHVGCCVLHTDESNMSDFSNEHAVDHYGQAINQYVTWLSANQQSDEVKTVATTVEIGRSIEEAKIGFHIRRYCADAVES